MVTLPLRIKVSAFAALVCFFAILSIGSVLVWKQQKFKSRLIEDGVWHVYQLDREIAKFKQALTDRSNIPDDELVLQFDILYSRASLFERGQVARLMGLVESDKALSGDIVSNIMSIDKVFSLWKSEGFKEDENIIRFIKSNLSDVQRASDKLLLKANQFVYHLKGYEYESSIRLYGYVFSLLIIMSLSVVVVLSNLFKEYRINKQRMNELEQLTYQLSQAVDKANLASNAKSEFLATMSHEIRTPMNAIIGFSNLLVEQPLDTQSLEYSENIRSSGKLLLNLINDILDYSKVEAGKLTIYPVAISLRSEIHGIASLFSVRDNSGQVFFLIDIDDEIPDDLFYDVDRLRQVIINLLSNAFKFTDSGRVSLCVEKKGDSYIRFSVFDTGNGIAHEQQPLIFNSFMQADSSSSRRYGGTGLGLAICKRLVEAMDGDINFVSEPRLGSHFWFDLPLQQAPQRSKETSSPMHESVTVASCILLVEDNEVNQEVAKALLEKQGHNVTIAGSGYAALEICRKRHFDLVLMDVQMPEMDGFETTRCLREQFSKNELPIIALTANVMPGGRSRCLEAGMNDYLSKPVNPQELRQKLAEFLPLMSETELASAEPECQYAVKTAQVLLDEETLCCLFEELGEDSAKSLIALFFERLEERLEAVSLAVNGNDISAVVRELHSLKGASGTLGLMAISDIAEKYEALCEKKQALDADAFNKQVRELKGSTEARLYEWYKKDNRGVLLCH